MPIYPIGNKMIRGAGRRKHNNTQPDWRAALTQPASFTLTAQVIRFICIFALLGLSACQTTQQNAQQAFPNGQGRYVRPAFLNPLPPPRIPAPDDCQSQLFQGLLGQPEGAIYIPGLPGTKRVLKPAFDEGFGSEDGFYNEDDPLSLGPTIVQVRDYLPGQSLYAPSIRTPASLQVASDVDLTRLTLQLDEAGFVREVRCG